MATPGKYPNQLGHYIKRASTNAAALGRAVGTTRQEIHKLVHGERQLTKLWAERLAPPLGISWWQLMGAPNPGFAETSPTLDPSAELNRKDDEFADISERVHAMLGTIGLPQDPRTVAKIARQVDREMMALTRLPFEERLEFAISEARSRLKRRLDELLRLT